MTKEKHSAVNAPQGSSDVADAAPNLIAVMQAIFREPVSAGVSDTVAARQRYAAALSEIAILMRRIDAGKDIVEQFIILSSAISDLQFGTVHPILLPDQSKSGRPKDRSDVRMGREWAAIALYCFLRAGDSRETAANYAARKAPSLKRLCRPGAELKSSLLNWYETSRSNRDTGPEARGGRAAAASLVALELSPDEWREMGRAWLKKSAQRAKTIVEA